MKLAASRSRRAAMAPRPRTACQTGRVRILPGGGIDKIFHLPVHQTPKAHKKSSPSVRQGPGSTRARWRASGAAHLEGLEASVAERAPYPLGGTKVEMAEP